MTHAVARPVTAAIAVARTALVVALHGVAASNRVAEADEAAANQVTEGAHRIATTRRLGGAPWISATDAVAGGCGHMEPPHTTSPPGPVGSSQPLIEQQAKLAPHIWGATQVVGIRHAHAQLRVGVGVVVGQCGASGATVPAHCPALRKMPPPRPIILAQPSMSARHPGGHAAVETRLKPAMPPQPMGSL